MKQKILSAVLMLLLSVYTFGQSGTCGTDLTWTLENGVLTISGTGPMSNHNSVYTVPWYNYRDAITTIQMDEGITRISSYVFHSCSNLTSVTIPDGVTYIGNSAFCACKSLTSIVIPYGVVNMGSSVFEDCTNLVSISVPETCHGFSSYSFENCTSLQTFIIPEGTTDITWNVFKNCQSLTSVYVPNSMKRFSDGSFEGCNSLTSIYVPEGLTLIGNTAFKGCTSLTSLNLPSTMTLIARDAFKDCTFITDVYISANPDDLTWNDNACDDFKPGKTTLCHVPTEYLDAYIAKWSTGNSSTDVNVTFVGDYVPPTPATINLTANQDPEHSTDYYCTFYDSSVKYSLPAEVEAYIATISGNSLLLSKIAGEGDVIPADEAVILKAKSSTITLTVSDAAGVTITAANALLGVDVETDTPDNCYVLSGGSEGVGFYQYRMPDRLKAHKAYVIHNGGLSAAPRRLAFVFQNEQTATGVEEIEKVKSQATNKVLRDGKLIIIREGVEYNAVGLIVK